MSKSQPQAHFEPLPPDLCEAVLQRLGFSSLPDPSAENLFHLCDAWCRKVPFDNLLKRIFIHGGGSGPLPGSTAREFFSQWLEHGTGGTCWAGAGASHALLCTLGFPAKRRIATMLPYPDLPPNHGTVEVRFSESECYLFDSSILHGTPLRLPSPGDAGAETAVDHPAWGCRAYHRAGGLHILWRPLHHPHGFECRLETIPADAEAFSLLHNRTRGWSPFNYELAVRINRGNRVLGVVRGKAVAIDAGSFLPGGLLDRNSRCEYLVGELGYSEAIVARLPLDEPTPPPPGSATAAKQERMHDFD